MTTRHQDYEPPDRPVGVTDDVDKQWRSAEWNIGIGGLAAVKIGTLGMAIFAKGSAQSDP